MACGNREELRHPQPSGCEAPYRQQQQALPCQGHLEGGLGQQLYQRRTACPQVYLPQESLPAWPCFLRSLCPGTRKARAASAVQKLAAQHESWNYPLRARHQKPSVVFPTAKTAVVVVAMGAVVRQTTVVAAVLRRQYRRRPHAQLAAAQQQRCSSADVWLENQGQAKRVLDALARWHLWRRHHI